MISADVGGGVNVTEEVVVVVVVAPSSLLLLPAPIAQSK
jgi:hypothetical protein